VPKDKAFYLSTGVYDWSTGKAGTLQVQLPSLPAQGPNPAPPSGAR